MRSEAFKGHVLRGIQRQCPEASKGNALSGIQRPCAQRHPKAMRSVASKGHALRGIQRQCPVASKGHALSGIQRQCAQWHSKAMPRGIRPHELIKRKDLGYGVGQQLIRHSRRDPTEAHRATRVAYSLDVVAAEDAVRVWVRV